MVAVQAVRGKSSYRHARKNPSNVSHAHIARPSRLQQPTIWKQPEPTSYDAFVKDSIKCSAGSIPQTVARTHIMARRDERGGGGARVWHSSSHSLTKWCNTPPYMLAYIPPNFPCETKLSSHLLPLCIQKLRLHITRAHIYGL
jgi:hypothetical protein